MQLKALLSDDDAVSPVIGVILMVAITVILAAVIATFVLGLGDRVSDSAPQASFSFDWDGSSSTSGDLTIRHSGGDTVDAQNLYVRGEYGGTNGSINLNWADDGQYGSNSEVSAGNSLTIEDDIDGDDTQVASDGEVDVVWERSEGDSSATLGSWSGPDA